MYLILNKNLVFICIFFGEFNYASALIISMLSCTFSSFNIFVNENKKVVVQPKRLFQNKDDLVIKAENAVIKM